MPAPPYIIDRWSQQIARCFVANLEMRSVSCFSIYIGIFVGERSTTESRNIRQSIISRTANLHNIMDFLFPGIVVRFFPGDSYETQHINLSSRWSAGKPAPAEAYFLLYHLFQ
jgi:hypothetical protein